MPSSSVLKHPASGYGNIKVFVVWVLFFFVVVVVVVVFCSWCLDPLHFITYCASHWLKLYLWDFHICICWPILTEWSWDGSGVYTLLTKEVLSERSCICSHLLPGDPQLWLTSFTLHKEVSLISRPLSASAFGFDSQGRCLWLSA